jgi:hypothetical protein
MRLSAEYALRARAEIDIDEPSIEALQALLLLALSFIAEGKGKKAYMLLGDLECTVADAHADFS